MPSTIALLTFADAMTPAQLAAVSGADVADSSTSESDTLPDVPMLASPDVDEGRGATPLSLGARRW
jgi:hypothetical protein